MSLDFTSGAPPAPQLKALDLTGPRILATFADGSTQDVGAGLPAQADVDEVPDDGPAGWILLKGNGAAAVWGDPAALTKPVADRVGALESRLSADEAVLAAHALALGNLSAASDAHQASIAANQSAIALLQAAVAAAQAAGGANATAIADAQAAIAALTAKVTLQGTKLDSVEAIAASLQTAQTANQALDAAQAADIDSLRGSRATNEAAIAAAQQAILSLQGYRTTDAAAIAANAAAITALQVLRTTDAAAIAANGQAIAALQTAATTDEANIASNSAEISALKARASTAESNIASNGLGIVALQTRATAVEGRVSTNEAAIAGIQSQIQVPLLVIQAAAGEQGLRDALATGLAKITAPATIVVVDIPAQPDIQLTAPIVLDSLEAPRFFIRAPAPDLIPAPNAIVSAVATGANNVWGVPLYDVTFATAAAHGLSVNDNVMIVGRSVNGTPTGAYQPLAGYHRVRAVPSATQVTFRIPSMVSLANLATALTGANSLALTMHRFRAHLIAPLNSPVLSITNTRLLGMANLGLECQANDNGVNAVPLFVRGVSTQIATMGSLGIRGGATGFNLLNGAVMKFGGPSASIIPSSDWIFAITGASNGCVINVGTYFDANNSTSFSSCGNSLDAVVCQSSEADFPLLGMYGGNGQGAMKAIKRVRAFFRITTIPLGIGSNVGNAGNQVFADAVSYIDCQGLNSNIAVSPAANAIGNNGSFISR